MIIFRSTIGGDYSAANSTEYFTHADTNRTIYVGPYVNSSVYGQLNFADNAIIYTGILDDQSQVGFTAYQNRQLQANDAGFYWDVSGNTGSATLVGGDFGDVLRTGGADDTLMGGAGDDVLEGGLGTNVIDGGTGNDTVSYEHYVRPNIAALVARAAPLFTIGVTVDLGSGFASDQLFFQATLSDTLSNIHNIRGSDLGDLLTGDDNDNVIEGGAGADTMDGGGLGSDSASYEHAGAGVTASLLDPSANTGDAAGDMYFGIANLIGSSFGDRLTGGAKENVLTGREGNDVLDGGRGADTMIGGVGNDVYVVRDAGDVVTELSGQGLDSVKTTISYTLTANVERLYLYGTGDIDGTGNGQRNFLQGNTADNVLDGKGGNDVMTGFGGSDTFAFTTALAGNVDRITDFDASNDFIGLSGTLFSSLAFDNGVLAPGEFAVINATTKPPSSAHLFFNTDKGVLYYDADGYHSPGKPIAFAVLDGAPNLTADNFHLI